jgi:acetolactate synthase I/II/III large subunit
MHAVAQLNNYAVKLERKYLEGKIPAPGSTLADLIISYLATIGTHHIFGVPGGAIEPLYNALARAARQDPVPVRAVIARHETGAAFMADGYTRETGRLGVCCSTTGPGATNLITGVSSAYADRIPMLVITAQTALPNFGRLGLQESSCDGIDTVGMLRNCTRYSSLVSHPSQLEKKLYKALNIAFSKPQGPVHLSIPVDVLNSSWVSQSITNLDNLVRKPEIIDNDKIESLCKELLHARKTVLFLGAGCRGAMKEIMQFAETAGIPIVTTPPAKSLVYAYHPLYRGVFGFAGHDSAQQALTDSEVDLVIAAGSRLSETSTHGWDDKALMNDRLVHIGECHEIFSNSPMARLQILGSLRNIFSRLTAFYNEQIKGPAKQKNCFPSTDIIEFDRHRMHCANFAPPQLIITNAEGYKSDKAPIKPQRLMCELVKRFPDDTRFVIDAGNSWAWSIHYLHPKSPGYYHIGMGFGSMTWAIGASIGMAIGAKGKPVVCITGDGSYLMSSQEITVAVQLKLPVIFILINDSALGMVKHGQRMGKGEAIGFELPEIDFAEIAVGMGAQAFTIHSPKDFDSININDILQAGKPTLFNIYIDPEEPPPMGARMKVLDRRQSDRRDYHDRRFKNKNEPAEA